MVIFLNMVVKTVLKTVGVFVLVFLSYILLIPKGKAASPTFYFNPSTGVVKDVSKGFTVDILIDSGGEELLGARMTFVFDPRKIQMKKASRNNSLFDQWPEDESTLDNENGVVMLTGFTQSGADELYSTTGDPDVFARIEFEVVAPDIDTNARLEWEYNGEYELFKTGLLVDGSPPQNILNAAPTDAIFNLNDGSQDNGDGDDDGDGSDGDDGTPQTAVDMSSIPFIVGGFLIFSAGVVITSKPSATRKKFGTVAVYDD